MTCIPPVYMGDTQENGQKWPKPPFKYHVWLNTNDTGRRPLVGGYQEEHNEQG